MTLVQCNIKYNAKSGKETVTWRPKSPKLKAGDEIKFTSGDPATAIDFKKGSPFSGSGGPETIHIGTEKVLTVVKPAKQHFDCGTLSLTASSGKKTGFVSWGGTGGDIP